MPVSVAQFLSTLQKSGLLSPEQLAQAKADAPGAADGEQLARSLIKQGLLTRWQAGQLLLGRTLFTMGNYRLLELLGKGNMGRVFLGEHMTMNRRVALKVVGRGMQKNPAALERFFAEARAVAALDHPNIVRAYDVDKVDDQYYLVMEYVEGRDLGRVVEEDGPMDYAGAAEAIRQAADGLAHAHERGMIHCDIKPGNLLINRQGTVKILDLGLARLAGGDDSNPAAEQTAGTVDYMAPEQALGGSFDHRVDIYSLGCTFYYLLAGHPPFPEGTLHQRILKHQTQEPESILHRRPDAPRELVRICRKMMAKDPAERFATAEEASRALQEWRAEKRVLKRAKPLEEAGAAESGASALEAIAEMAHSSSSSPKLRKSVKRSSGPPPWIIGIAIGAVALMLIIVVIGLGMALKKPPRAKPAAEPGLGKPTHPEQEIGPKPWATQESSPEIKEREKKAQEAKSASKPADKNGSHPKTPEKKEDKKQPPVAPNKPTPPSTAKPASAKLASPQADLAAQIDRSRPPPAGAETPTNNLFEALGPKATASG